MATSLIVAHRGFSTDFPENTMLAFREAVAAGANAIELDIWNTSDGVPVVIHDSTLDRTTDGTGAVGAHSWSQIRQLDAGGWKDPAFAGAGDCRVPRLEDLLNEFNGLPVFLMLQFKQVQSVTAALSLIRVRDMGHQCFVFSNTSVINSVKAGDERFFTLNDGMPSITAGTFAAALSNAVTNGHDAVSFSANVSESEMEDMIDQIHAAGKIAVASYIASNFAARTQTLINLDCDFILGDNPDVMAGVMDGNSLSQRTPGERWPAVPSGGASDVWAKLDGEWQRPSAILEKRDGVWA